MVGRDLCRRGSVDSLFPEMVFDLLTLLLSETPYLCPFIIRSGGTLYAFTDLRKADGPFRNVVDHRTAGVMTLASWLNHPDRSKWLVTTPRVRWNLSRLDQSL